MSLSLVAALVALRTLPLVVRAPPAAASLASFVSRERDGLLDAAERHGAVLLRGFAHATTADDFSAGAQALRLAPFDGRESAAPRTAVAPHVFTANEAPPSEQIPFHHEMAQAGSSPRYVLFFCETPATKGGATPLVRSHDVARDLCERHPLAAVDLDLRGIRYARTMPLDEDRASPIGRSWRTTYGASTRAEAEAAMRRKGIEWEWLADGALRTLSPRRDIFGRGPDGRLTFFNSAVAARRAWRDRRNDPDQAIVFADDGAPLDRAARAALDDAGRYMDAHRSRFSWRAGDLLLLDNRQVLHARESFVPPRRVLASLWGERDDAEAASG